MFAIPDDTAQEVLAAPANIARVIASLDDSNEALSLQKKYAMMAVTGADRVFAMLPGDNAGSSLAFA